jgi:hypothetical protein
MQQAQKDYDNISSTAAQQVTSKTNTEAMLIQSKFGAVTQGVQGGGQIASAGMEASIAEAESAKQEDEVRRELMKKSQEKLSKNESDMATMRNGEQQLFTKLTEASHKRASAA